MESAYPECQKCSTGVLVPLSDYGREGASIRYKAWVCTNPECGFNLKSVKSKKCKSAKLLQSH